MFTSSGQYRYIQIAGPGINDKPFIPIISVNVSLIPLYGFQKISSYVGILGLHITVNMFPKILMDLGSLLGSLLAALLNYKRDPYVQP